MRDVRDSSGVFQTPEGEFRAPPPARETVRKRHDDARAPAPGVFATLRSPLVIPLIPKCPRAHHRARSEVPVLRNFFQNFFRRSSEKPAAAPGFFGVFANPRLRFVHVLLEQSVEQQVFFFFFGFVRRVVRCADVSGTTAFRCSRVAPRHPSG